jgi:hypothetical protein
VTLVYKQGMVRAFAEACAVCQSQQPRVIAPAAAGVNVNQITLVDTANGGITLPVAQEAGSGKGSSGGGSSIGAIVGGIVGGIVVAVLLLLCECFSSPSLLQGSHATQPEMAGFKLWWSAHVQWSSVLCCFCSQTRMRSGVDRC